MPLALVLALLLLETVEEAPAPQLPGSESCLCHLLAHHELIV